MIKLNNYWQTIICGAILSISGSTGQLTKIPAADEVVLSPEVGIAENVTEDTAITTPTEVATTPAPEQVRSTPQKSEPKPVTQTPAPTPVPTPASSTNTTPTYTYPDIYSFEEAYNGICPDKVPEGASYGKLNPAVTLGYGVRDYGTYKDLESAAVYAWALIRGGFSGRSVEIYLQRWTNLTAYTLNVDPSSKAVSWVYKGSAPQPNGPSAEVSSKLDALASQLRALLASLDQQFYAKCDY